MKSPKSSMSASSTSATKKSVKISDDGFLKSMRDYFTLKNVNFAEELNFLISNDDRRKDRMRLSDLKS